MRIKPGISWWKKRENIPRHTQNGLRYTYLEPGTDLNRTETTVTGRRVSWLIDWLTFIRNHYGPHKAVGIVSSAVRTAHVQCAPQWKNNKTSSSSPVQMILERIKNCNAHSSLIYFGFQKIQFSSQPSRRIWRISLCTKNREIFFRRATRPEWNPFGIWVATTFFIPARPLSIPLW